MKGLAKKFGAELVGLDFAVKSEESILSKLQMTDGDVKKLTDLNRYTMVFPVETYVDSTEKVLDELRRLGYQMNIKNYWQPGDPYQGINVDMTFPGSDVSVELQFHTPDSFHTKQVLLHTYYKQYGKSQDNDERLNLYMKMSKLAMDIKIPDWKVLNIGTPKFVPFKPLS